MSKDRVILVVDDETVILRLVGMALRDQDWQVLMAGNGQEALEEYEVADPKPAILLTDIMMPRMNGFELSRRLQELDPQLKVLYMSAIAEQLEAQIPAEQLISKPFSPPKLIERLERLFGE